MSTHFYDRNREAMTVLCPSTVMAIDGLPNLGKNEVPETCLTLINIMTAAEIPALADQIKSERQRYTKLQHLQKIDEVRLFFSFHRVRA